MSTPTTGRTNSGLIASSILLGSLILSAAIIFAPLRQGPSLAPASTKVAVDLHPTVGVPDKATVLSVVKNPKNQPLIAAFCKLERGFAIDPAAPLWVLATSAEDEIHVGYATTHSDGTSAEITLGFTKDVYGRFAMETKPPIYLP